MSVLASTCIVAGGPGESDTDIMQPLLYHECYGHRGEAAYEAREPERVDTDSQNRGLKTGLDLVQWLGRLGGVDEGWTE